MKKSQLFMIFIILTVIVSISFFSYKYVHAKKDAEKTYRTVKVKKDKLDVIITSTGLVSSVTQIDVKSEVGGKVMRLPYEEGAKVKKGSLLAVIDDSQISEQCKQSQADYESSLAMYQQALVNVDLQKSTSDVSIATKKDALEKAQIAYNQTKEELEQQKKVTMTQIDHARASLDIAKKQLTEALAGSREQDIAKEVENVKQAEVSMDNAKKEYDRQKELYGKDYVSKQNLDATEKAYLLAQSQYNSAKEQYDLVVEGTRPETIKVNEAQVTEADKALQTQITLGEQNIALKVHALELAKKDLTLAQLALQDVIVQAGQLDVKVKDVASRQAAMNKSDAVNKENLDKLSKTQIISPIDGVIVSRPINVGDVVASQTMSSAAGTTLMTLADLNGIYATANIDESDIGKLKNDLKVTIMAAAYPDLKIPGRIIYIASQAVKVENIPTFQVKIQILLDEIKEKNLPKGKTRYTLLFPGMSIDADIHVETKSDVLLLPIEVIEDKDDGGKYVTVINGKNQFEKRDITVGSNNSVTTEVLSGVSEGEEIKYPEIDLTKPQPQNTPRHKR